MGTTTNPDEKLLEEARELTRIKGRTALINEALQALIEREAARRIKRLGGSQPDLVDTPRRRTEPA